MILKCIGLTAVSATAESAGAAAAASSAGTAVVRFYFDTGNAFMQELVSFSAVAYLSG